MTHRGLSAAIAGFAIALVASPASADCQEELAKFQGQAQTQAAGADGIAKDGSLAPLENDAASADSSASVGTPAEATDMSDSAGEATAEAGEGDVVKDGSETPLETDLSGVATSGQEAEAQQQDDAATALAEKGPATMSQDAEAALARAEAALEAGDEAGCMQAVEEARSL